jgi:phage repressor protein C with HTH and peptisase S24 domain
METMKERIAHRMSDLGLIKQSVFKALERYLKENGFDPVSQPALSKVMTGRTKNPWFLPHLARVLECDPDWLRYGIKPVAKTVNTAEVSDYVTIQQYTDVRGAMGKGAALLDEVGEVIDWRVSKLWASNLPANTGINNLRIVTGLGPSMKGMFNSGDPLIVDIGVKSLDYDAVYFFRVGDEGFIKLLQKVPGEGVRVLSKNEDFPPWYIRSDMDFEIFGRVLKVWEGKDL